MLLTYNSNQDYWPTWTEDGSGLSPSGDVVAQLGSMFGHLQTFSSVQSDLHLYRGLVP